MTEPGLPLLMIICRIVAAMKAWGRISRWCFRWIPALSRKPKYAKRHARVYLLPLAKAKHSLGMGKTAGWYRRFAFAENTERKTGTTLTHIPIS